MTPMGDAMAEVKKPEEPQDEHDAQDTNDVDAVTAELHKEIDAVPAADRALLLRLVKTYREETAAEAYDRWFRKAVAIGKREADAGHLIDHEVLKAKWQAKRAAQMD